MELNIVNKKVSDTYTYLSKACKQCLEGQKLVLFITGICPQNCWYCPIGDHKNKKDLIQANEKIIHSPEEAIEEAKLCNSQGAGITGGDPLAKLDRTIEYIKAFKKYFTKKFHIHLYTTLTLLNKEAIKQLEDAGLDEIRIHPDLENKKNWKKIKLLKKFKGETCIEIPAIPKLEEQTRELIHFAKNYVNSFNFNELETADTEQNKVYEKGYRTKDETSYAIQDSEKLGIELVKHCKENDIKAHFCSAKCKDSIQMMNRIKARKENVKKEYDLETDDGTLIRGAIYLEKPSFNYREQLLKKNKEEELKKLKNVKNILSKELKMAKKDLNIDLVKYRILCSRKIIYKKKDLIKKLNYIPAIVEELPTGDWFEIEIEYF